MKRNTKARAVLCAVCLALFGAVMAGCAGNNGMPSIAANQEQQTDRSYMSQVSEVMDQLGVGLDSFVDAVSRGDVVNMRTQADDAYQALDKLSGLEAPEGFADIQQGYQNGTAKLREALDAYIALYTEIEGGSFDWSTYDSRIAAVQSLYDEGTTALQQADEAAAAKANS